MTVRFAGFDIPLMDTLSDPFKPEIEVLLVVVFAVLFTPISGVVTVGAILIGVVVFSACFVVVVMQPVAHYQSNNDTQGKWDNKFHRDFVTRRFVCFHY